MDKTLKAEGSAYARMVQLMRTYGANKDTDVEVGKIIKPFPDMQVELQSDDITLDMDDLIIAQSLLPRSETVEIDGYSRTITYYPQLKVGDHVILISADTAQNYYLIDKVAEVD